MPRPAKGARIWLNPADDKWVVLDTGNVFIRTGCGATDRGGAEKRLQAYLAAKFRPIDRESDPARVSVAAVLAAYGQEVVPSNKPHSISAAGYNIATLLAWWGTRKLSEVNKVTCEAYATWRMTTPIKSRTPAQAAKPPRYVRPATVRRELALFGSAIAHWHSAHGPLNAVPVVSLPSKPAARQRWLTRTQAALLLAGAIGFYRSAWSDIASRKQNAAWRRHRPGINRHLGRFILSGLYHGSRKQVILDTQWMVNLTGGWVDLERGVLHRKPSDEAETKKRKPPARLGRRILAHMRRWRVQDEAARQRALAAGVEDAQLLYRYVVTWRGKHISSVRTAWALAVELAGLDGEVIRHTLRHTRATWMMLNRVDEWEASGHLGMSVQTLRDTYGHHHPDWQSEAAEV